MSLILEILSDERNGEVLALDKTTSLGRDADVSFDDAKMSKVHVIFELDAYLGWFVKDTDSKNGLIVNGAKTHTHLLTESDLIEVGKTQFRVVSVSSYWKPLLNQLLIETHDSAANAPMAMYPFRTIPTLTFTQGIQAGTTYVLEYGPRIAGGESDDIQIFEPNCPDTAFDLSASKQGVVFSTKYPQIAKLNKKAQTKKVLKKGDQIHIHNTVIKIDFINL